MGPGGRPSGMTSAYTHTIVGVFPTPQIAKTAVGELESSGFSRDQISIVTTAAETPDVGPVSATGSQEDVGEKAAIGGAAGFILGIAALAVPGVGPILAAGPLAAALTGAAAGAATGGLIGVFTKEGIPEEAAKRYSKAIGSGQLMVTVHADAARVDQAAGILDRAGAIEVDEPSEHVTGAPRFDESDSLVARQRSRERRVRVYPGITGGGSSPTVSN
jgi:hypothetical protein